MSSCRRRNDCRCGSTEQFTGSGQGDHQFLPLLEEYPQSARLALGLQKLAEEIATSPESMDVLLADGIALLQRLYANNERGSTQVDDPSLYDRIVELVSQEVEEVAPPPDPQREGDAAAAPLERTRKLISAP